MHIFVASFGCTFANCSLDLDAKLNKFAPKTFKFSTEIIQNWKCFVYRLWFPDYWIISAFRAKREIISDEIIENFIKFLSFSESFHDGKRHSKTHKHSTRQNISDRNTRNTKTWTTGNPMQKMIDASGNYGKQKKNSAQQMSAQKKAHCVNSLRKKDKNFRRLAMLFIICCQHRAVHWSLVAFNCFYMFSVRSNDRFNHNFNALCATTID